MNASDGQEWSRIHDQEASWREKIVGEISHVFIVPQIGRAHV